MRRGLALSARWPGGLKPSSPLRAGEVGELKPPSPLRVRIGCFGVFFGRRGDAGFIGPLLWVCSGVVGFNVAVFLSPVRDVFRPASPAPAAVREKVRPAALWSSCRREKVRPASPKWPKIGVLWRAGRVFSRKCRWRGCAGRVFSRSSSRVILLGELCRAVALAPGPFYWQC